MTAPFPAGWWRRHGRFLPQPADTTHRDLPPCREAPRDDGRAAGRAHAARTYLGAAGGPARLGSAPSCRRPRVSQPPAALRLHPPPAANRQRPRLAVTAPSGNASPTPPGSWRGGAARPGPARPDLRKSWLPRAAMGRVAPPERSKFPRRAVLCLRRDLSRVAKVAAAGRERCGLRGAKAKAEPGPGRRSLPLSDGRAADWQRGGSPGTGAAAAVGLRSRVWGRCRKPKKRWKAPYVPRGKSATAPSSHGTSLLNQKPTCSRRGWKEITTFTNRAVNVREWDLQRISRDFESWRPHQNEQNQWVIVCEHKIFLTALLLFPVPDFKVQNLLSCPSSSCRIFFPFCCWRTKWPPPANSWTFL